MIERSFPKILRCECCDPLCSVLVWESMLIRILLKLFAVLRNGNSAETFRLRLMLLGGPKDLVSRTHDNDNVSRVLQPKL